MASPTLILLLLFTALPFLMAFGFSFTDQRLVPGPNPTEFVGLRNFARLIEDERFLAALRNNFVFALVVVPSQTALGLFLALLVNQKRPFVKVFRAVFFSPIAITSVAVAQIWGIMYLEGPNGMMNQIAHLLSFGLIGPQEWLRNENLALLSIMNLSIWQGVGLQMTLFLAGLQEIPTQLYEAARIDGASRWQQLRFITIPQLRNAIIYVTVTATILAFRLFTPVDILTQGGPINATTTTIYHTYQNGFQQLRLGYASAMTVIFFLIIFAIAWMERTVIRRDSIRV